MQGLEAVFWGFVGGVSLLIVALIGLYAEASRRIIASSMGSKATEETSTPVLIATTIAYKVGGFDAASIGRLLGAVACFAADQAVSRRGASTVSARRASSGRLGHSGRRRGADGR